MYRAERWEKSGAKRGILVVTKGWAVLYFSRSVLILSLTHLLHPRVEVHFHFFPI